MFSNNSSQKLGYQKETRKDFYKRGLQSAVSNLKGEKRWREKVFLNVWGQSRSSVHLNHSICFFLLWGTGISAKSLYTQKFRTVWQWLYVQWITLWVKTQKTCILSVLHDRQKREKIIINKKDYYAWNT